MSTPEPKEARAYTHVDVFNIGEEELDRLANWLDCAIVKCGEHEETHIIRFIIPHTNVKITYFA